MKKGMCIFALLGHFVIQQKLTENCKSTIIKKFFKHWCNSLKELSPLACRARIEAFSLPALQCRGRRRTAHLSPCEAQAHSPLSIRIKCPTAKRQNKEKIIHTNINAFLPSVQSLFTCRCIFT